MPHSSTVSFISYWRGLQPSPERAPARARFDPARLKSLIPQMLMISATDSAWRFRLSGGFLVTVHGLELRGTSFLNLFQPPFTNPVRVALGSAVRRQQPLILRLAAPWQVHRATDDESRNETVTLEICLCPVTNAEGEVDRLVGICQTLSPMPRNRHGMLGRYTLMSARIHDHHSAVRAAHLRLVASGGRRIA